ncbi:MAG: hypothetical protein M0Z61_06190 [Nitrospiraceae bacterium]|nr:hypothetical protein [Nitrospiraceae bacterium]
MKILYILKKELDATGHGILERHKAAQQVTVVHLNEKSAPELLDLIEGTDKLIMW